MAPAQSHKKGALPNAGRDPSFSDVPFDDGTSPVHRAKPPCAGSYFSAGAWDVPP